MDNNDEAGLSWTLCLENDRAGPQRGRSCSCRQLVSERQVNAGTVVADLDVATVCRAEEDAATDDGGQSQDFSGMVSHVHESVGTCLSYVAAKRVLLSVLKGGE